MPANDPQGEGPKDPWGRPIKDTPEFSKFLKDLFKGGKSSKDGDDSGEKEPAIGRYALIAVLLLVVIWAVSGIFIVSPAQESVVTRFGQYSATLGPGPHWIPQFIDSQTTLDVQQVRNFPYQAEMLTKDENIVSVSLAVQYRISNPRNYLFNVVNPVQTLQEATSSALRAVVGSMTLNSVLTTGRQELRDMVAKQLNNILSLYQMGLTVTDVTLQPAKPPEQVTAAFDDAIKAREDEQRFINQARAYAKRVISIAQGQVARLKQSADAYKKEVVLKAQGATARYLALLKPYEAAPTVTRDRLYLDTVSTVLSNTHNIVVDNKGTNVLYLPLEQILRKQIPAIAGQGLPGNSTVVPPEKEPTTSQSTVSTPSLMSYGNPRPTYSPSRGGVQ